MGPTILFTHLKIILLQCFQFSVFSNNKLNPNGPYIIYVVGGQDLSFCVGLEAPFISKSTFEEKEPFGKTP